MGNEESAPSDNFTKSGSSGMKRQSTPNSVPQRNSDNPEAPPAYDDLFGPPGGASSSAGPPRTSVQSPVHANPPATQYFPASVVGHGSHTNGLLHSGNYNQNALLSTTTSTQSNAGRLSPSFFANSRLPQWQQEEEERELRMWFENVDENNDGHITAEELRMALLNDNWTPFNMDTIKMMLKMFDKNSNDRIEFEEFAGLKRYVQEWKKVFDQYDDDHSGTIDVNEIQQAFQGMGYTFSHPFCATLCRRFSSNRSIQSINLDAFIYACAMVNALSKDHERNRRGISFEDFLRQWIASS
ncbi:sorcin-like isoform X2 [Paramacrobiotus metropolitanus]|uniref:sorcin-like isoform X2 n=1 Tax=Paramacrobiotus metropolitanus TaxID=2943436 RepID=UPI0024462636|nr:sorcin-like isoform X2 [Paramacrobiotus metropolitanus]